MSPQRAESELRPGTWNKVTVILAPAMQEDLAYVEFSMTVEQVKLDDSKK